MEATQVILRLSWGLIPGTVEGQLHWSATREALESDPVLYREMLDASTLAMMDHCDPARWNWVVLEWTWL
jgi:hypothetical protein